MPSSSPYPRFDVPDVDLWKFLFDSKERQYPDDKIIYQDAETLRSYTYGQVKSTAVEFGKGLKSTWQWKKGDVLAIFSPNSVDIPPVMWGTHWAGGVITTANPAYTAEELAFQLKDTNARVLAAQMSSLSVAVEAAKLAGIPDDRIILIGEETHPTAKYKHFTSVQNISRSTRYLKTRVDPAKDLAFLVYSSGTTGVPKGVRLTHTNIVSNVLQLSAGEAGNLTWNGNADGKGDRVLAFLPFFHIYGLTCLLHKAIYSGLHLVVMTRFDLERWCEHVQNFRITFSYIVPPVAMLLTKHPVISKYDLSSLRMMNSGAAPLSRELVDAVYARIKCGTKQGYGLSECSPTTHTVAWEDWQTRAGSVGKLLPNLEAKYMTTPDDDDPSSSVPKEVSAGEVGELYVRGPNVFTGYHNNPSATAGCLSPDGWFQTGDVGYEDADGNFFITDRVKELIKYKGFQVAPAELEGVLAGNQAVADVAVVGVESAEHGSEVPRAYVVAANTNTDTGKVADPPTPALAEKIEQWLAAKVAPYKRLRGGVRFVDEIPKNPSGKILRRALKEQAKNEAATVKARL